MTIPEALKKRRDDILRIAASHGATEVRILWSVARMQEQPESNVDFLVEIGEGRSSLDLPVMWNDLEELLGRKVHVVEPESLL